MIKQVSEMNLEELHNYNHTLCVQHFTKRLDFPTNTNEDERKWYDDQFKLIKEREIELKEKGE